MNQIELCLLLEAQEAAEDAAPQYTVNCGRLMRKPAGGWWQYVPVDDYTTMYPKPDGTPRALAGYKLVCQADNNLKLFYYVRS